MEYFNNQAPVYIASNLSSKTKSEKWAGTELEQAEQRCARVGSARRRRSSGIGRVVGPRIYLCAAANTHMHSVGEEPLFGQPGAAGSWPPGSHPLSDAALHLFVGASSSNHASS